MAQSRQRTEPIYNKHWGAVSQLFSSHGWPRSANAWEDQMLFLASHGCRCVAYDQRGHGRRLQPADQRERRDDRRSAHREVPTVAGSLADFA